MVHGEVEKQFDQSDLAFVCVVEALLLDAANSEMYLKSQKRLPCISEKRLILLI